jgi:hypothetical protein
MGESLDRAPVTEVILVASFEVGDVLFEGLSEG